MSLEDGGGLHCVHVVAPWMSGGALFCHHVAEEAICHLMLTWGRCAGVLRTDNVGDVVGGRLRLGGRPFEAMVRRCDSVFHGC